MKSVFGLICRRLVRALKCAVNIAIITAPQQNTKGCQQLLTLANSSKQCHAFFNWRFEWGITDFAHRIALSASIIARSARIQLLSEVRA